MTHLSLVAINWEFNNVVYNDPFCCSSFIYLFIYVIFNFVTDVILSYQVLFGYESFV